MIIMTEAARGRFLKLMPEGRAESEALRLDRARAAATNNGDEPELAVYLAEPEEGDDTVEHKGQPLLYVSCKVSAAFDGCEVERVRGGPRGDP